MLRSLRNTCLINGLGGIGLIFICTRFVLINCATHKRTHYLYYPNLCRLSQAQTAITVLDLLFVGHDRDYGAGGVYRYLVEI